MWANCRRSTIPTCFSTWATPPRSSVPIARRCFATTRALIRMRRDRRSARSRQSRPPDTRAATEKRSDQAIDSPRFRFRNAANCRRKQAEGQEFRAQAALRGRGCTAYKFMICSRQGPACRRGASVFEIPLLHPSVASAPGRQSKIPTRRRRYGGPAPRADTDHLRMPVLVRIGRLGRALFGAYQPVQLADRRGHLALQRSDDVRSG